MPSAPLAVMPFDPAIVRPARAGIELKRTVRVSAISRRDVLKRLLIIQHKPTPRSGQQQWLVKNLPRGVIIKETETTPDSKLAEPQAMLRSPCIFLLGKPSALRLTPFASLRLCAKFNPDDFTQSRKEQKEVRRQVR